MAKKAKDKKPQAQAAAPAPAKKTAPAAEKTVEAAKPAAPQKRVFVTPVKPGGNFPGKDVGKGGPKPQGGMPKGRIIRNQGR